jgi:hypothetical protein
MPDPWELPPLPKRGDSSERVTYAAMGRALTMWEHLESNLSYLFSVMTALDPWKMTAIRKYGDRGGAFSARFKGLQIAAEKYFTRYPSQNDESGFEALSERVEGFSMRRNDIAHSVLRPFHFLTHPGGTLLHAPKHYRWCLLPPYFKANKFLATHVKPKYAFTSKELGVFARQFDLLAAEVYRLMKRLDAQHFASRHKPVPPTPVLRTVLNPRQEK